MGATSSLFLAGTSIIAAQGEARAFETQARFSSEMNAINKRRAELAAEDALKRGDKAKAAHLQKVKGFSGAQKVALAAQGVALDKGSAADIQEDTQMLGYEDALTIQNNAFREALGYGQQAQAYATQGAMAQIEGASRASSTMLTGGMRGIGYMADWYDKGGYNDLKKAFFAKG